MTAGEMCHAHRSPTAPFVFPVACARPFPRSHAEPKPCASARARVACPHSYRRRMAVVARRHAKLPLPPALACSASLTCPVASTPRVAAVARVGKRFKRNRRAPRGAAGHRRKACARKAHGREEGHGRGGGGDANVAAHNLCRSQGAKPLPSRTPSRRLHCFPPASPAPPLVA